jgi:molecular chaperone HscB
MEYFAVLGLDPALKLDASELEKRFYAASRELHPDRHARGTAQQQVEALSKSSLLTVAYRTLKEPHSRAEYLLEQQGVVSKDLSPGFLEQAFALNELVEEGGEAERQKLHAMLTDIDAKLEQLYGDWDGSRRAETLQEIRRTLNQRRYIENLVHGHV